VIAHAVGVTPICSVFSEEKKLSIFAPAHTLPDWSMEWVTPASEISRWNCSHGNLLRDPSGAAERRPFRLQIAIISASLMNQAVMAVARRPASTTRGDRLMRTATYSILCGLALDEAGELLLCPSNRG
jgi:hypothetical protein